MCACIRMAGTVMLVAALGAYSPAMADDVASEPTFAGNAAILSALSKLADDDDEPQARNATFEKIRTFDAADRGELVRNLVMFARDAQSIRAGMVSGAVLRELQIPSRDVIDAAIPLLDADDEMLKEQAENILGGYEDRSAVRPPDFSTYREIIETADREGHPQPRGLIAHMLKEHPGHGLLTVARALRLGERDHAELKRIVWAEHVIADATWRQQNGFLDRESADPDALTQLSLLARNDAWWVRRYAAEILHKNPSFRDPQVIGQLAADGDALVRDAIRELAPQPNPED